MAFEPQTAEQYRTEMMAELLTTTELTDAEESGAAFGIIGVTAVANAQIDRRIQRLYQAFGFNGKGPDLDDRCSLLPGFEPRQGPTAASGACMQFTRTTAAVAITVAAGIRIVSKNDATVEFITTEAFTMGVGEFTYPLPGGTPVRAVCLTLGPQGNAATGVLDGLSYVTNPAIVSCTNIARMTGGLNRESDQKLRRRALDYIASLCQTTPVALEYLARSFTASDGTRVLHAFIVEDANTPAFAELVVDDGTGMQGSTRPGAPTGGTTPASGQLTFWFESPAATTPKVTIAGVVYPSNQPSLREWVTIHERGVGQMHPDSTLLTGPGVVWACADYTVYYGLIAELQWAIEALMSLPSRAPGWRTPGGRVRVVAPTMQFITITGNLTISDGYEFDDVESRCIDAVTAYLQALAPGKRLVLFQLAAELRKVEGVEDIHFTAPADNIDPATLKSKLYPAAGGLDFAA